MEEMVPSGHEESDISIQNHKHGWLHTSNSNKFLTFLYFNLQTVHSQANFLLSVIDLRSSIKEALTPATVMQHEATCKFLLMLIAKTLLQTSYERSRGPHRHS